MIDNTRYERQSLMYLAASHNHWQMQIEFTPNYEDSQWFYWQSSRVQFEVK